METSNSRTPRLWLALLLNLIVCPMGFFYLKNLKRLMIWSVILVLTPLVFSFYAWLWPKVFWGRLHLALILLFLPIYYFGIIKETLGVYRKKQFSDHKYFRIPYTFLSVPLTCIILMIATGWHDTLKKTFFSTHTIPTPSQFPNIMYADLIFANRKFAKSSLKRGTMVAFKQPSEHLREGEPEKELLKRIVGLPGETIAFKPIKLASCKCEVTEISINAKPMQYRQKPSPAYLNKNEIGEYDEFFSESDGHTEYMIAADILKRLDSTGADKGEVRLGEDEYFLLGDYRTNSLDSRHFGPVKYENMVAIYAYTYFSVHVPRAYQTDTQPVFLEIFKSHSKFRPELTGFVAE